MNETWTEEEMRQALFGNAKKRSRECRWRRRNQAERHRRPLNKNEKKNV